MISALINESKYVFCPPPPGKPDPNEPRKSNQTRRRVIQLPQKGDTCSYYALQILRNEKKIGKYPSESERAAREIEMWFSHHRKMVTKVHKTLGIQNNRLAKQTYWGNLTQEKARTFLESPAAQIKGMQGWEEFREPLQSFCNQKEYETFYAYTNAKYMQALMDVHEQLLKKFVPSLEEFLQNSVLKKYKKKWEEMSLGEKKIHENNMVFLLSHIEYGLNVSSWHPEHSCEGLIKQLQLHGPHLVGGEFGQDSYEDPPFELIEKIENRPIFGWKPNAKKNPHFSTPHTVVIVGARIHNEKELVYFIDPNDGSDPNDITTQKIYVITYKRLKSSIFSLYGEQIKNKQGEVMFLSLREKENNYALFA